MKVPFIIYADFEALVKKMDRCERPEGTKVSCTEKTEIREILATPHPIVDSRRLGESQIRDRVSYLQ